MPSDAASPVIPPTSTLDTPNQPQMNETINASLDISAIRNTGEYGEHHESLLPRQLRQRLHKHFERIEREFEIEFQKILAENYNLQEKLEKFEEGEHLGQLTLIKKPPASQLSHRIKQQYKQSTSRLVSSLRPSISIAGPSTSTTSNVYTAGRNTPTTGSFPGHAGSWRLIHHFPGHRDGIWEVTSLHNLVASASADSTARIWSNNDQPSCLLVYSGHSGSVNSVRFREKDLLLLTSSGDGTAHLIRLPMKLFVPSHLTTDAAGPSSGLDGISDYVDGSDMSHPTSDPSSLYNSQAEHASFDSFQSAPGLPMILKNPSFVFQSASLGLPSTSGHESAFSESIIDSYPLTAADFLSDRDQLVTAGWDRLARLYDLHTGQEVQTLTGHDHQLTDVRSTETGLPVIVTSARDSTFRLWDFRTHCLGVHVQQAHNRTVSTAQFLPGLSPEHLISAGTDRCCKLWDLRHCRSPVFTARIDSGINRLAISRTRPSDKSVSDAPTTASFAARPTSSAGAVAAACQASDVSQRKSLSTGACLSQHASLAGSSGDSSSNAPPTTSHSSAALSALTSSCVIALPTDNRTVRFIDMNGSRFGRLPRSPSIGHSRVVTSATWANEGRCNLITSGFDHQLLGWQVQII